MKERSSRMIDVFQHILPPRYKDALLRKTRGYYTIESYDRNPALFDLDIRFRDMDKYEGLVQVLTLPGPPVENVADAQEAAELAVIANDGMAELVSRYPDRFAAAVACLPMNNMDAALREADRAIKELNFRGVQIYTSIRGKPLDQAEFAGLYEMMARYHLPIWIHPVRDRSIADYPGEKVSRYKLFAQFGYPYETSLAMARLVFGGVLEKYPDVKFITHHCGGMIPFFEQRIAMRVIYHPDNYDKPDHVEELTRPPLEYFRKFYADTALAGSKSAVMCGYAFFGAENLLFGTDYPYAAEKADLRFRQTMNSVKLMDVPAGEKEKIFEGNAERLLQLHQ